MNTFRTVWSKLGDALENYQKSVAELRVAPVLDPARLRRELQDLDFGCGRGLAEAVDLAVAALTRDQVHTPHPRYFGLFNPAPHVAGVAGDALAAAFNPQLAAWSHSPWAAEVERHVLRSFGERLGLGTTDGTFCSGGMEANHTAMLCALARRWPMFLDRGARALDAQPVLYASAESHHSVLRAARLCGVGGEAVRLIAVDDGLRMCPAALSDAIAADRATGLAPFLVVGTAGTTNAGVVDPLADLAAVAEREDLWMHVDAAWGGAAVLAPELRPLLAGIERARSVTVDAHKWLSCPMGAGMFLTRDLAALGDTFRLRTAYMPKEAEGLDIVDPHQHSIQWSRRFTGLKVFLTLLVLGWDGCAAMVRHMTAMGDLLREQLKADGWRVVNDTALPVVCFIAGDGDAEAQRRIVSHVTGSGEAWISTAVLAGQTTAIRACITNWRTQPEDIDALVASVGRARAALGIIK